MQGFETIIHSILTLGLAMLIGFVCVKTGYITEEQKNGLSRIIVRVTLPILVITSLTSIDFDREKLINSIHVLLISILVIAMLYLIGAAISKIGKIGGTKAPMYRCMMCFGNVVFMAFPLIQALYGAEGLLYAAIYELANDMFLWTVGVYTLGQTREDNIKIPIKERLKKLLNPGTIAFTSAFIMMALGLKFTGIVADVMSGIGGTTTYLSMLFIGGTLASVDFRRIYTRLWLFVLTAVKMIIVPVILILILRVFNLSDTAQAVIILQAAMPTSTVVVMLGMEYGADVPYCAEGVFITHILGLLTLPLCFYLMNVL
ncbi:MAG: AEC family transporter [Oscillospiraceae bacterium]|nr:AEC family transporter [Oscillospiraceae bacterium]